MGIWTNFVRRMAAALALALVGLYAAGAALDHAQRDYYGYGDTFFTFRLEDFDNAPYWFLASLALMAINGFYVYRWAALEASLATPGWGPFRRGYEVQIPVAELKIVAVNLVCIPGLLVLFLVIRHARYW